MILRRKFNSILIGLLMWAAVAPRAIADSPDEILFKKVLNYIAQAILRYYASVWYENTKKQMEEFGDYNEKNIEEKQNKFRENIARLGDSYNQVIKTQYDKQMQIEAQPTIYPCSSESTTKNSVSIESTTAKRVSQNSRSMIVGGQVNPNAAIVRNKIATFDDPKANQNFDFELLTDVIGYKEDSDYNQYKLAHSIVDKLVGPEPLMYSSNIEEASFNSIKHRNAEISNVAMRNLIKTSLEWLISKRKKNLIDEPYDSSLDSIIKPYNVEDGVSFLESLSIHVDMYSAGGEFLEKVTEIGGLTPLAITLVEMKALENKLLFEVAKANDIISKLSAIELLRQN